jgi:membrane-associated protease RseP (regulator of RpoE activity)
MLNETASSIEDRPALRPSGRTAPSDSSPLHNELRHILMEFMLIERELIADERIAGRENLLMIGPDSRLVASFEGRLLLDSEEAYERLSARLAERDHLPLFREVDGKHIVHLVSGLARPQRRPWWPNAALFAATLFSVLIVGTLIAAGEALMDNPILANQIVNDLIPNLWRGLPYAISILLILGAHELGHYFAGRHHRISVTLPYFIPAPPFISPIGTFGAFIQLREPIKNRKVLLDVGAAGPLMGLVFAIPILFIGLATSPVGPLTASGLVEGNSLLYALMKTIVFGRFLPDATSDVYLNQLAQAGWTGLLVTALNLIPIGQLDGGHILYSLIGDFARRLYYPLMAGVVALVFLFSDAWLFWLILLFLFGRVYATPLDMITRLDRRRQLIALLAIFLFIVTFVPVPFTFRVAETPMPLGRESAHLLLPVAVLLTALWAGRRRFIRPRFHRASIADDRRPR